MKVFILTASGYYMGDWSSPWESIEGVFSSREKALAAQAASELKLCDWEITEMEVQ